MQGLEAVLREGVAQRVYQHANAVVLHRGRTVFSGGTTAPDARFDLASITKVMSTTALCCALKVDRSTTVGSVFPSAKSAHVTVADLLTHRSGLPAFEPFFARCKTREHVVLEALQTAPIAPVGVAAVYSDIGFIVLGELISVLHGSTLDQLFAKHIATPLGMAESGFNPPTDQLIISTGGTRPREPAPGQEGLWSVPTGPSREGDVDDDNAYVMGGVAGHAGLFGSARDVAAFGQAVLTGRIAFEGGGWPRDLTPGSTRTFGFDTPSAIGASCGQRFGPQAIGHLGFTGTSLWVDFGRELVVALLTNRVIFGRANQQIRQFRPLFHDAVLDELRL